jgi:hypothetical protein
VVKLKGKLSEILVESGATGASAPAESGAALSSGRFENRQKIRQIRQEAQTALSHLGYRPFDVERTLNDLSEDV